MRFKRPFTFYARPVKDGKPLWYVSWYDAAGCRQRGSTGETNKALAETKAMKMTRSRTGKAPTVEEYAAGFFAWGSSWVKRQLAKGRGCSEEWTRSRHAMLDKHFIPRFKKTRLDALTRPMIEKVLVELPLSNQTRNHILYAAKTVLQEAEDENLIDRNPLDRAEPMGKQGRRRDAFTLAELSLLFPKTAKGLLKVWGSPKYAALFVTLATTGTREGEARALCWRHVLAERSQRRRSKSAPGS